MSLHRPTVQSSDVAPAAKALKVSTTTPSDTDGKYFMNTTSAGTGAAVPPWM